MDSRSEKRFREEHPELSPNPDHKKKKKKKHRSVLKNREAEPNELNAVHSELLPKPEPTPMEPEKGSMVKLEGAESIKPNADEQCPKPDSTLPKDPDPELLSKPESILPSDPDRKKKRKRKRSVLQRERAELDDLNANYPELFPKPDPLSPKDSDPELVPKPEPAPPKDSGPELLSKPEPAPPKDPDQQKKKKKRNKKMKRVLNCEGAESNRPNVEHSQLRHKPDPTPLKDLHPELLVKPEPAFPKDPGPELLPKPQSTSSLINPDPELLHIPEPTPPKDPDPEMLPKPRPTPYLINPDPELHPIPEPASEKGPDQQKKKKRNRKKKSMPNGEEVKSNRPNAEHPQLRHKPDPTPLKDVDHELPPKPEPAPPKDPDPELLPKPQPTPALINPDPELLPTPEPVTPKDPDQQKKKKKRNKKNKSMPNAEGAESNRPNADHPEICHKLDPTASKDPYPKQLPITEPTIPKELDLMKKRKQQQKKENKSVLNPEGAESNKLTAVLPLQSSEGLAVSKKRLSYGEKYVRCTMCGRLGHRPKNCSVVRALAKNQEICYFCGQGGHTLGKCPVAPGGAILANRLHKEREHSSKDSPQNAYGIDPKVIVADEPVKTSAGTEEMSIDEATNMEGGMDLNMSSSQMTDVVVDQGLVV